MTGVEPVAGIPKFEISGEGSKGIISETIKRSEEGKGIVLRLYESLGGRAWGKVDMWVGSSLSRLAHEEDPG